MAEETYDVVILGTGPAGLQAAIHAARKKVRVLVLGREQKSSLYSAHIENYCCMTTVTGETLLEQGRIQAENAGAVLVNEDVIGISSEQESFVVTVEGGRAFRTASIILAMGISRNKLKVPGEKEFLGRGVSYCVECDANFYRDDVVVVTGSESAAVSGALTLLFYARAVHLVCNELRVVEALAEQLRESAIVLHEGRRVGEIKGKDGVESIILDDGTEISAKGIFIELGAKGAVELSTSLGVMLDAETMQYIAADKKQETNIPGVYAAGDICGPPWQVAKAVGEGCVAGLEAASYAKRLRKEAEG
jgi:thioredoxin reductase (NADPH)